MSLWSQSLRSDPTSVLPIGMPLSLITRATVVIFSELVFAVSFTVSSFDCFLLGNTGRKNADICAFNVTERGKQIQTCLISLNRNPSSGKMATSERITYIGLLWAHIVEG